MKFDRRIVARDVLLVLVILFVAFRAAVRALGGLDLAAAVATCFLALTAGFCLAGCLSPRARFSHLGAVAVGVWLLANLLNTITRGFPVESAWMLALGSLPPVAGSMLLGGALSLAVVRTPALEGPVRDSPGDSSSSQA